MQFSYVLIDGSQVIEPTLELIKAHDAFLCVAVCANRTEGINKILELKPDVVFMHLDGLSSADEDAIQLSLLSELHEFLDVMPTIIVLSSSKEQAFDAYQRGVYGYLLHPIDPNELRKCLFRFQKTHQALYADKIAIKSNGDYHFISTQDIVYLKADNNTTDIHLISGKVISGFKTLKYYESQLPSSFFRIHNSHIVNLNYVTRINVGKSDCYLLDNTIKLPFSRTYKEQIDLIIKRLG